MFSKIGLFLRQTKNVKGVAVEEYFPCTLLTVHFLLTLCSRCAVDHVQELYRLKKIVAKLKFGLQTEDGSETS